VSAIILRSHPHKHLPLLEVNPNLFETRFAAGCDTRRCNATCCADGVTLDVIERDRILAHAELVKQSMSPGQDKDTAHWFEDREVEDRDFVSGRAAYTMANDHGCVFLDEDKLCVLQRAQASLGAVTLKPFFCTAFPVVIDKNALGFDPLLTLAETPECCAEDPAGPLTMFDVCAMELEFVVGAEGVEELRRLAEERSKSGT
jgi:Fe-S-cluster containining protein